MAANGHECCAEKLGASSSSWFRSWSRRWRRCRPSWPSKTPPTRSTKCVRTKPLALLRLMLISSFLDMFGPMPARATAQAHLALVPGSCSHSVWRWLYEEMATFIIHATLQTCRPQWAMHIQQFHIDAFRTQYEHYGHSPNDFKYCRMQ